MSFPQNWIADKLTQAHRDGRLAHAYLISGPSMDELESLMRTLVERWMGTQGFLHPDVHELRPESKSRRISVEQIRNLEKDLRLKSLHHKTKLGILWSADRMCLGKAEAANAFLKTLEEPPDHCVLFLISDRATQFLPTILSRCLQLSLPARQVDHPDAESQKPIADWLSCQGEPIAKAYRRSRILSDWWGRLREAAQASLSGVELDEEAAKAHLESAFLLRRDQSIEWLLREIWSQRRSHHLHSEAVVACQALEDLRTALQRNVDPQLALETCHLRIARQSRSL